MRKLRKSFARGFVLSECEFPELLRHSVSDRAPYFYARAVVRMHAEAVRMHADLRVAAAGSRT